MNENWGCKECGHVTFVTEANKDDQNKCPKCRGTMVTEAVLIQTFGKDWKAKARKMEFIHNFPVIARFHLPERDGLRHGEMVLVDRGDTYTSERYVTAQHCYGDNEWLYGHYITELRDASLDFFKRVASEYGYDKDNRPPKTKGPSKSDREDFAGFCKNATDAQLFGIEDKEKAAHRSAYLKIVQEEIKRRNLR